MQNLKDRKHILSIMKKLQWWIVRQAFLFGATALPTDTSTATTTPIDNWLGLGGYMAKNTESTDTLS